MNPDPWLSRWLPLVELRAMGSSILEIGCGGGDDTRVLAAAGLQVVAFDSSPSEVGRARAALDVTRASLGSARASLGSTRASLGSTRASLGSTRASPESAQAQQGRVPTPRTIIECRDLRDPFPLSKTGVVVASLSLHYFPWQETVSIVTRIRKVLRPGGILLCRLNSTEDHYWGASGHPVIEPGYYNVDGEPKRFFDEPTIRRLFTADWQFLFLEHRVTHKYTLPKAVWEIVVEKPSA